MGQELGAATRLNVRLPDTERIVSMQPQFTTPPTFSDPRLPARFWEKVRIAPNGCWDWIAAKGTKGYGYFRIGGRLRLAHRLAYETLIAPIPAGLESDHLCRNRACVQPDHIEPVTHLENLLRGLTLIAANVAKTHCPQGHPYDEANTYIRSRGGRECRTCHRDSIRRRYQAMVRVGGHDEAAGIAWLAIMGNQVKVVLNE